MASMRQAFSDWCNEHDVASQFEAWNPSEMQFVVQILLCVRWRSWSSLHENNMCMHMYSFFDWAFRLWCDSVPSLFWLWLPDANSTGTTTRDGCGAGCVLQAYISRLWESWDPEWCKCANNEYVWLKIPCLFSVDVSGIAEKKITHVMLWRSYGRFDQTSAKVDANHIPHTLMEPTIFASLGFDARQSGEDALHKVLREAAKRPPPLWPFDKNMKFGFHTFVLNRQVCEYYSRHETSEGRVTLEL